MQLGLEKVKIQERKRKHLALAGKQNNTLLSSNKMEREAEKKTNCALAGSRTRIYCLEGSNADRYTTNACTRKGCTTLGFVSWRVWWPRQNNTLIHLPMVAYKGRDATMLPRSCDYAPQIM